MLQYLAGLVAVLDMTASTEALAGTVASRISASQLQLLAALEPVLVVGGTGGPGA